MEFKKDIFKNLRIIAGLTQEEVANKIGVSKTAVSYWEREDRSEQPRASRAYKLANILRCSVIDFTDLPPEDFMSQTPGPKAAGCIQNTPALRECIKDAMQQEGIKNALELNQRVGYDSPHSLSRLLDGELAWFPDILSAVLDALNIKHAAAPMTQSERSLLAPEGLYNEGAMLVRPIPVVDWANAANYIDNLVCGTGALAQKWDPESTETIPAPVGVRRDTIALRVNGQSMEPKIMDGDKLYCEPVDNISDIPNNKIVVVRFTDSAQSCPGCLVCKRFRRIGGAICLTSDNPAPASRSFDDVPLSDIAWIGKVVGKYDDGF